MESDIFHSANLQDRVDALGLTREQALDMLYGMSGVEENIYKAIYKVRAISKEDINKRSYSQFAHIMYISVDRIPEILFKLQREEYLYDENRKAILPQM